MSGMGVSVESISDRTSGGANRPRLSETPIADLTLDFQFGGSDVHGPVEATLRVIPGPRLEEYLPPRELALPLSKGLLAGAVAKCQAVWWSKVVEHSALGYTFHRNAQKAMAPADFHSDVLPHIAEAGDQLYVQIFRPKHPRYETTSAYGGLLRDVLLSQTNPLRILIRSESFMAPWNLLYLGDPSVPDPDFFLGAKHVVEHDVSDSLLAPAEMARPERVALHLDENIDAAKDTKAFRAVQDFVSLLRRNRLQWVNRNSKAALLAEFRRGVPETAFYFLCHGTAGSDVRPDSDDTKLYLTRTPQTLDEGITPSDIDSSLDRVGGLQGQPVVFLNACRALKTGSSYYRGFVSSFLNADARAVIGPEIEMPTIFAREFARLFFERWYGGGPNRTIGLVLLGLRREFLHEHGNPLGLTYSLYRGSGHYLPASSALV